MKEFTLNDPWFDPEGLDGLGASVRRLPYMYAATDLSIAAGATKQGSIKIDGDSGFVADTRLFQARTTATIGSSLAGTLLQREPFGDSAGGEIDALSLVTILVTVNARRLSNIAIPATLWTGNGTNPGYPLRKLWVPAGATLQYEIFNGASITIHTDIGFDGVRIYKN